MPTAQIDSIAKYLPGRRRESIIVDPDGNIVAKADAGAQILNADIDLSLVEVARKTGHTLRSFAQKPTNNSYTSLT